VEREKPPAIARIPFLSTLLPRASTKTAPILMTSNKQTRQPRKHVPRLYAPPSTSLFRVELLIDGTQGAPLPSAASTGSSPSATASKSNNAESIVVNMIGVAAALGAAALAL